MHVFASDSLLKAQPAYSGRGMRKMSGWFSATMTCGIFIGLVLLELRRPLRKRRSEPKLRRNIRNMAVAGTSAVAIMLTAAPVTTPLTRWVERRKWGVTKWLRLPLAVEGTVALILLDYLLYLWHVAFHKMRSEEHTSELQ